MGRSSFFKYNIGGQANTGSIVGQGGSTAVTVPSASIDMATQQNRAVTVPRAGTITSVTGFFSVSEAVTFSGSTVAIKMQVFVAPAKSNVFTFVSGTEVSLGALVGNTWEGTVYSGIASELSIPVTAQSRILVVYSAAVTSGLDIALTVKGYVETSIGIS
ncbi:MAG: exosporium glycoprotein BclB-related protein [Oscillospiraceae bacterium]